MLSLLSLKSNMKTLLVVLLYVKTVYGQETVYGMQMKSFSGNSGPSGSGGSSGMGWDSLGPASVSSSGGSTGRGRVVSNSILDLDEPNTMEMENENMEMIFRQQPSVYPMMMNRPQMTGPSIGTGQMLEPTRSPGGNGIGMTGTGISANSNGSSNNKVHRYVSVHVAPEFPAKMRPSQSTPKLKPETHYQILFIKAPSSVPQEIQQIELPPPPQMKTLVYVLLKKDNLSDLMKISQPPKVRPAKPEVFFIRYKGQKSQQSRDEQKSEDEDMMVSNGNMNVNNGIGSNNEEGTNPRSTTSRPYAGNRGNGMVQPQGAGVNGQMSMMQASGVTGPMGMMQASGGTGSMGMMQPSVVYGPKKGDMGTQTGGVTGPVNRGMGMMQASGAYGPINGGMGTQNAGVTGPINRGMGMMQTSGGSGPANKGMGMVPSSGGSGTSNNGMQMGMAQALGGYGNAEIADSDFSSDFNENQYLQAYRRRQQHQNQRQVRSGFTFLPSRRYGIVY